MKKIIIPFEGAGFSEGAFAFATMLQKENPILLTGVLLPKVDYNTFFFFPSAFAAPAYIPTNEDADEANIENVGKKVILSSSFTGFCLAFNVVKAHLKRILFVSPDSFSNFSICWNNLLRFCSKLLIVKDFCKKISASSLTL